MLIKSFTIENFKGIRDPISIELKPITLLFGPNSAGKSTIIQAIHYAYEVLGKRNPDPNFTTFGGESVDLGGFENIVNDHDLRKSIRMRFDLNLKGVAIPIYADDEQLVLIDDWHIFDESRDILHWEISSKAETAWVEFQVSWSKTQMIPYVSCYSVGINGQRIAEISFTEKNKAEISHINFFHPLITIHDHDFEKVLTDHFILKKDIEKTKNTYVLCIQSIYDALRYINVWFDQSAIPEDRAESMRLIYDALNEQETGELISKTIDSIGNDIVKTFTELDFWLLCHTIFDVSMINGDVNIPCNNQHDALPKWNQPLRLNASKSYKESIKGWSQNAHAESVIATLSQILVGPGELLKNTLEQFRYIGPIRNNIPRNYVPNRYIEDRNWANGLTAWDALHKENNEFIENTNKWISEMIKCGYRIHRKIYKELDLDSDFINDFFIEDNQNTYNIKEKLKKIPAKTRIFLTDSKTGLEVLPADVGMGISQVLPIVVAVLYKGSALLAIEQPELHIHPALQVNLADLFIAHIKNYDKIFFIETHSEYLLLRLLRRIREKYDDELPPGAEGLDPEHLRIYYIVNTNNGVQASELKVTEDGDSKGKWPEGFFEERHKELY